MNCEDDLYAIRSELARLKTMLQDVQKICLIGFLFLISFVALGIISASCMLASISNVLELNAETVGQINQILQLIGEILAQMAGV